MAVNPQQQRDYVRTAAVNSIVTVPAAGAIIADSGALPAGVYDVQAAGSYGGTADVIDNMSVSYGGAFLSMLPVIPVANSAPIFVTFPGLVVNQGEHITIKAVLAGGAGSVYRGTIVATPVRTQYGR